PRPAAMRDDRGQARGLRLEDDVAEGVGRAREDEEIGAGIGRRQRVAVEESGEQHVGAFVLGRERLEMRTVADHDEIPGVSALLEGAEGLEQSVEILLPRHAADVEKLESVSEPEAAVELRVAPAGVEADEVDAA